MHLDPNAISAPDELVIEAPLAEVWNEVREHNRGQAEPRSQAHEHTHAKHNFVQEESECMPLVIFLGAQHRAIKGGVKLRERGRARRLAVLLG